MQLIVLGVNHKNAPLVLRELVAIESVRMADLCQDLCATGALGGFFISTCNRTEMYCLSPNSAHADSLRAWFSHAMAVHTLSADELGVAIDSSKSLSEICQDFWYEYREMDAVLHLLRVGSGLDSMILGEPQIFGQIKSAVAVAQSVGAIGGQMQALLQEIFSAIKTVRASTLLGAQSVSLGSACARLAVQMFGDLHTKTVLLVGAGEMNRLVAKHLVAMGALNVRIANRTPMRAQALIDELGTGHYVPLDNLDVNADIIVSCTGAIHTLIDVPMVMRAHKVRKQRSMLLIDLAVPRDIDAKVGDIDNVRLYCIDDLQALVQDNMASRAQAALDAEVLASQLAHQIIMRLSARQSAPAIARYRQACMRQKDDLLAQARHALQHGADVDTVLVQLANRLTGSLIHAPTLLLKSNPSLLEQLLCDNDTSGAVHLNKAITSARHAKSANSTHQTSANHGKGQGVRTVCPFAHGKAVS